MILQRANIPNIRNTRNQDIKNKKMESSWKKEL